MQRERKRKDKVLVAVIKCYTTGVFEYYLSFYMLQVKKKYETN